MLTYIAAEKKNTLDDGEKVVSRVFGTLVLLSGARRWLHQRRARRRPL